MSTENDKEVEFNLDENELNIDTSKPKAIEDEFEEELKKLEQPEVNEEQSPDPEIIKEAKQFGHKSKEQWVAEGKDPNLWKPESEFVKYGREYKEVNVKLKTLEQQNAEHLKKIDLLIEAQKRKEEQAVLQAKQQLALELQQAKEMGNIDAVEQLTKKKVELDVQDQNAIIERNAREIQRVDTLFTQRNAYWFNESNPHLLNEVNMIAQRLRAENPNLPYVEKARLIESEIKFNHPELNVPLQTRTQLTASDSAVAKSSSTAISSEDRLLKSLSSEERAEYNVIKNRLENSRLKIKYTVKEYIDQTNTLKKRGM